MDKEKFSPREGEAARERHRMNLETLRLLLNYLAGIIGMIGGFGVAFYFLHLICG